MKTHRPIEVPKELDSVQAQLRYLIVSRGFTVESFAEKMGVSRAYVQRYIALPKRATTYGRKTISGHILNRMLDALYVPLETRKNINRLAAKSVGYQL